MRKIEREMIAAINNRKNWKNGNTEVLSTREDALVRLHGSVIAVINADGTARYSLAGWNTPTTRSRVNALIHAFDASGAGVSTKLGQATVRDASGERKIYSDEWFKINERGIA